MSATLKLAKDPRHALATSKGGEIVDSDAVRIGVIYEKARNGMIGNRG
jgi:hypothetical protein